MSFPDSPLPWTSKIPAQINQDLRNRLANHLGLSEANAVSFEILDAVAGLSRTEVLISEHPLDEATLHKLEMVVHQMENGKPLQYVLGRSWFCGLPLCVGPGALIPRPETEELVRWILEEDNQKQKSVMDLCTGSGCIPLALRYLGDWLSVSGMDISPEALTYAHGSAEQHQLLVRWVEGDIFQLGQTEEKFDVISANPPYILPEEAPDMAPHVLNFEPHLALFTPGNQAIIFYQTIARWGLQALKPHGKLFFELNPVTAGAVGSSLKNLGYCEIEVRQDMQGKNRMLRAVLPDN